MTFAAQTFIPKPKKIEKTPVPDYQRMQSAGVNLEKNKAFSDLMINLNPHETRKSMDFMKN